MKPIVMNVHLYAIWDQYMQEWSYQPSQVDMSGHGWVLVETKAVEFAHPGPDADWSAAAIAATKVEQARIRAEAEAKCTALDGRIQSMLALEHTPE